MGGGRGRETNTLIYKHLVWVRKNEIIFKISKTLRRGPGDREDFFPICFSCASGRGSTAIGSVRFNNSQRTIVLRDSDSDSKRGKLLDLTQAEKKKENVRHATELL